jgi:hypothetical protein
MFGARPMLAVGMAVAFFVAAPLSLRAQQNQVMGEVQFSGVTKVEKQSGVWIDGQYVGYLKELKGTKAILMPNPVSFLIWRLMKIIYCRFMYFGIATRGM